MDDKKKYVSPEAEIVELVDGDIITMSQGTVHNMGDGCDEELL